MKRLLFFIVVTVRCATVSAGDTAVPERTSGVPVIEPDYSAGVVEWWARHPFNTQTPGDKPTIVSPEPVIRLVDGESIQAAIDKLPATGGTIRLGAGTYDRFEIIARSHVHIVSDGGAVIRGYSRIAAGKLATDYAKFDLALHQKDPAAWECFRQPARDIYFKGLTFDGGGTERSAIILQRVYDVVFDDCVFHNFADPRQGHAGLVSGHMGLNNIWLRKCRFAGDARWAVYLDGAHGSGVLDCTLDKGFGSGGLLFLTNDDFSEDVNGNGRVDREEERNAKYIVIAGNTFAPTHSCIAFMGENLLAQNNTVTGPVARFASCDSKYCHINTSVAYRNFGSTFLGNTVPLCREAFVVMNGTGGVARPPHQTAQLGRYVIRDNRVASTPELVKHIGPIAEPNVVQAP